MIKRYGIFDDVPDTWHSTCVVVGAVLGDKPLLYVPKPVAWLLRAQRNFRIWYLGAKLDRQARRGAK